MHTAETIRSKLANSLPQLRQIYPIAQMALFGSVTRSDFDPVKSDIDIMVELDGEVGYKFIELAEELERLLEKKVDLVSRNAMRPHHWDYLKSKMVYV